MVLAEWMRMRFPLVVFSLLAACATSPDPSADEPDEPGTIGDGDGKADGAGCATEMHGITVHVCNLHEVSPGIYRGARPDARGLRDLAALGVRTDLDLETSASTTAIEEQQAVAAGVTFLPEPMSYLRAPSDELVDRLLGELNDPALQPVFLHCKLGNDRTGLIVALDRVINEGWTPEVAWNEMMDLGFHRIWVGLSHFFEERTGWDE